MKRWNSKNWCVCIHDLITCITGGLEQSSGEQGLCVQSNISLSIKSVLFDKLQVPLCIKQKINIKLVDYQEE